MQGGDDHPGAVVSLEPAHRSQPRLQSAMIGFDVVVGVLLGAVPRGWEQLVQYDREVPARSVTTSVGLTLVVPRACSKNRRAACASRRCDMNTSMTSELVDCPVHRPPLPGDLHIGLVCLPAVADGVAAGPGGLGQQRREPLNPPIDGDVVDLDPVFDQELFHVTVGQAKRRYQRTASTITSGGKRKLAKADRGTGMGRGRRVLMSLVSPLGRRRSQRNSPYRSDLTKHLQQGPGRRRPRRLLNNGSRPLNARRLTTRSQSPKATTEECRTMGVELAANGAAAQPGRSWPLAGSSHRQRGIPAEEDIMLIEHAHPPALRSRPLPGLRPRGRPAGPLLAGATRGAGLHRGPPVGPPGPPADQLGAVVLRHRDLGGRRRAPGRLIHVDARPRMEPVVRDDIGGNGHCDGHSVGLV
jgi:hypothetical protein